MAIPQGFRLAEDNIPAGFKLAEDEPDFLGAGVIEPLRAIGSGIDAAVSGGLTGLAQAINPLAEPGAGAATVEQFQSEAFSPTTKAGKENLAILAKVAEFGIDVVNFPISGLLGIVELVTNQGLEQAVETIKNVQGEQGLGKTLGSRTLEETGSPLAATIAETLPTAAAEAIGLKGAGAAISGIGKIAKPAADIASDVAGVFKIQSPAKQKISQLIQQGSTDIETAAFKLDQPTTAAGLPSPRPIPKTKLGEAIGIGAPRIVKDTAAVNAIGQGFDEGVIAAVKGASKDDKRSFMEMVNIMERGKKNARFAIENRPSDVVGDLLTGRLKVVRKANRDAGQQLDAVAKNLRGKPVEFQGAIDTFIGDLDDMGIVLARSEGGKVKAAFEGSDIEGLAGPQSAVNRIVIRLSSGRPPDAFELHRMKRFIDEQVTFGKNAEGLAGKTEVILKRLRRNLDEALDTNFPDYDKVNTQYAETIGALDAFQDAAGRKMDLTGPNAEKAVGTLMRRIMSNAQSRITVLDSVNEIEKVAKKFSRRLERPGLKIEGPTLKIEGPLHKALKNDLLTQILFVDELDSVFGPVAKTSFQGQIDQSVQRAARAARSPTEAAVEVAGAAAEKVRGINQEGAFKAIKRLLRGN